VGGRGVRSFVACVVLAGLVPVLLAGCSAATSSDSRAVGKPTSETTEPSATPTPTPTIPEFASVPAALASVGDTQDFGQIAFDGHRTYYHWDTQTSPGRLNTFMPGVGVASIDTSTALELGAKDLVDTGQVTDAGPASAPLIVYTTTVLRAAVGLQEASLELYAQSFDPATGQLVKATKLRSKPNASSYPDDFGNRFQAAPSTTAPIVALNLDDGTEEGWNARTGEIAWTTTGTYADPGAPDVALLAVDPQGGTSSTMCIQLHGVDPATGHDEWVVDFHDFKSYANDGTVTNDCDVDWHSGPAQQTPSPGTGSGMICANGEFDDHQRCYITGTNTVVSDDARHSTAYDPVTGSYVVGAASSWTSEFSVESKDGSTLYSVSSDKARNLDLQVLGIFDDFLYTKTRTGSPVLDLSTGQTVVDDYTGQLPVAIVNGYTVFADGSLTTGTFAPTH
jgi:hypothetical protein